MERNGKAERSAAEPGEKETPREVVSEAVGQGIRVAVGSVQVLHHMPNKQLGDLRPLKPMLSSVLDFFLFLLGF